MRLLYNMMRFGKFLGGGGSGGGSADKGWIGDGNTHIWITLQEGRTSPTLGVCPNGTVTVDWGDGTEPDILTGTSVTAVQWTPTHNYAKPGNYIISLTVDGSMGFYGDVGNNGYAGILRHSSARDARNKVYHNVVKKIECGNGTDISGSYLFYNSNSIQKIKISPDSTMIGNVAFSNCYSLTDVTIPEGITVIGDSAFANCYTLASVIMPDSVTAIGNSAFQYCHSLVSVKIPSGVKTIGSRIFNSNFGVRCYDFTKHTTVPTLSATDAFGGIATDCEIRVPAALYDEWIAATNWATYANNIVAV